MMTEHAWYAPIKVAMTVYRCSPNKLATCRFVMRRTKPASETRLRAGISNHGNAEKGEDQFKARITCWYLPQTTIHFKLFLMHQCMKKIEMFMNIPCISPPTNKISFQYLLWIDIWHKIGFFFMNIPYSLKFPILYMQYTSEQWLTHINIVYIITDFIYVHLRHNGIDGPKISFV